MTSYKDAFGTLVRAVNGVASSSGATALAALVIVLWALAGAPLHYSPFWQLLINTTSAVVTLLMVFVLNNAQSRDTAAINAKLDSIILAMENGDNRLIGIESMPESHATAVINDVRAAADDAIAAEPALRR